MLHLLEKKIVSRHLTGATGKLPSLIPFGKIHGSDPWTLQEAHLAAGLDTTFLGYNGHYGKRGNVRDGKWEEWEWQGWGIRKGKKGGTRRKRRSWGLLVLFPWGGRRPCARDHFEQLQ